MAAGLESMLADLTSGDDSRAEAAVPALAALGQTALPALRNLLSSPQVDARWWALRTLAQFKAPPLSWLIESLEDPSEEVRQCAALGLYHHPAEEAIPVLIHCLSDPDPLTVNLASNALVAVGAPAVPALLDLLRDAAHMTRVGTIRALASIGDPRAIPALMAALEEDSLNMKYWAEEGLERLGLDMVYMKFE